LQPFERGRNFSTQFHSIRQLIHSLPSIYFFQPTLSTVPFFFLVDFSLSGAPIGSDKDVTIITRKMSFPSQEQYNACTVAVFLVSIGQTNVLNLSCQKYEQLRKGIQIGLSKFVLHLN
jgi:hypothetical protein